MRMKCPNCGAQYEVDSTVIPESGRDVQCSNCGHTWFQRQAKQEAEIARHQVDAEVSAPVDVEETPPVKAEDAVTPETSAEPEAAEHQSAADADVSSDTEAEPPQRQQIDEEIVNVLREEAELETSKRSDTPPAQAPDPSPVADEESEKPEPDFAERSAQLHGPGAATDDYDSNRKALLPDIEEINSTLAATGAERGEEGDAATKELRRRSGFRRGFLLALVVFAAMALIYVFAPKIADILPGTETTLATYVDWINSLRVSVDGIMQGAVDKLTSLLSQISADQAG